MSSNSDGAEAIVGLIGVCLVVAAIVVVVYIALWVIGVLLGVGAVTGVGHALYNYQRAFSTNVRREV
jgi:hypothetical protein